jgi:hypothetical protein
VRRAEGLAHLLDSSISIPATRWRIGLDGLLGFIPVMGDALTALPVIYFIRTGKQLGAPLSLQIRILANAGVDFLVGTIPLVGDLFDLGFKRHRRNARLLRDYWERTRPPADRT